MKMIDIRRMDLNLLVAFEAIYEEGSVTQASERLHLTQSALSHGKSCETRERFFESPAKLVNDFSFVMSKR